MNINKYEKLFISVMIFEKNRTKGSFCFPFSSNNNFFQRYTFCSPYLFDFKKKQRSQGKLIQQSNFILPFLFENTFSIKNRPQAISSHSSWFVFSNKYNWRICFLSLLQLHLLIILHDLLDFFIETNKRQETS